MGAQPQDSWLLDTQPTVGLWHGFASVSMRLFLSVVLPLTAVFLLAFVLEYRAEVRAERARLLAQEAAVIQRGVGWVEREFEIATSDLHFVADLVAEAVGDGSPDRFTALERSALAFVRSRSSYFQIRFIDATGREIVQIGKAADGPRIAPKSELQDKSGRSYFTDTMRLESGEMFISLVPRRLLDDIAIQAATPLLVIAMPLYFALLAIGWALAAALQRRRLADETLRSFEAVRSAMMRAALDGIVVMDKAGTTLEFNRSAQEIFGYTREELRGRPVADLIVCPVMVAGNQLVCDFLRDLSEAGRGEAGADPQSASS